MMGEQVLLEMEERLQAASSAPLSAQHIASGKVEEARNCRRDLEDTKLRLDAEQVAANNTCGDAMVAKEVASRNKADYVVEKRRRREKDGELNRQLRQQVASAAAGSIELASVHLQLESLMARAISLNELYKMGYMERAAKRSPVE